MITVKVPDYEQEEELVRLMDTYGGMLISLCAVTLRDASWAQDAVQETFIKAYRHMDQLPEIQNERAWLIRIAMNTCRDLLRTGWFRHIDRKTSLEQLPEIGTEMETESRNILQEVQKLPLRERQAVLLYYWQNMTAEEIGNALGIDRATVYRRLDKARRRLKLMLTGEGGGEA